MARLDGNDYNRSVNIPETREVTPTRTAPTTDNPANNPAVNNYTSIIGENNFRADSFRNNLTRQANLLPTDVTASPSNFTPPPADITPYEALEQINALPVPSLNDPVATREYQEQRAALADAGLRNAQPPNRDDFDGLPPRLADMEYRDSLSYYNSAVSQLEEISVAANESLQASPTAVIDEAAQRVWDAAENDPHEGATALAQEIERLNATYGPEAGGQLMAKLYADSKADDYDHDLNNILSFAGGDEAGGFGGVGLTETQRNAIGTAIGQAYETMSPEDQTAFVNGLVAQTEGDSFRGHAVNYDPTRIADLISRGDNSQLKTDMVNALTKRMTEIEGGRLGNNGGVDIKALANSAAIIANSGANSTERAAMFNTIIRGFTEMDSGQLESLMEDPTLKDNLSRVFLDNSEAIVRALTNEAGGLLDAKSSDGLRVFFEMTMFSADGGELREEVMGEAVRLISEFADPTANPTSGRTKTDDARTAGSLIGLVQAAAINQKQAIEGDQEARAATTQMFVGMAFAFVPGASKVLGEGADKILELAYDKAVEFAQENTQSGLSGLINDLTDGDSLENIDEGFKAIRDLRFQVSNTLVDNEDLYNAFNDGYSVTGVDQLFVEVFGS